MDEMHTDTNYYYLYTFYLHKWVGRLFTVTVEYKGILITLKL